MAYAGDLKSLALRGVRVRLPPRAPTIQTGNANLPHPGGALRDTIQENCVPEYFNERFFAQPDRMVKGRALRQSEGKPGRNLDDARVGGI
jgi:hypothetical protein